MKAILKVLIVWMTLLAVPLQGFASATMSLCAPPPATAQHDHDAMADDMVATTAHARDEHATPETHAEHGPAAHHHSGKCTTCTTCGSCVAMAPSFIAVLPVSSAPSIIVPFDQRILPSVDLDLPERPPRA